MTKSELLKKFHELEELKNCHIENININCRKDTIQNAIDCLECSDSILEKYLVVISLKYENTGETIANNGDFKIHPYNRLYVFNTARQILA